MPFLIDGHNLIAQLPDIQLNDPHDEAKLVLKLRGFVARTKRRVTVIFDEGLPGGVSGLTTSSVEVIFASSRRTNADRIMIERIRDTVDVKAWTVVTSDEEVLQYARFRGMQTLRCREFVPILEPPPKPMVDRSEDPNLSLSAAEIREWLGIFGDDSAAPAPTPPKHTPATPALPTSSTPPAASPPSTTKSADKTPSSTGLPPLNDVAGWLKIFENDADAAAKARRAAAAQSQRYATEDPNQLMSDKNRKHWEPTVSPQLGESENPYVSPADVEAWLRLFGEGDDKTPPKKK